MSLVTDGGEEAESAIKAALDSALRPPIFRKEGRKSCPLNARDKELELLHAKI